MCVIYWDIWGRELALLDTEIFGAENWVCYLLEYLGQKFSCVIYCDNLVRELAVLVTEKFGAEY